MKSQSKFRTKQINDWITLICAVVLLSALLMQWSGVALAAPPAAGTVYVPGDLIETGSPAEGAFNEATRLNYYGDEAKTTCLTSSDPPSGSPLAFTILPYNDPQFTSKLTPIITQPDASGGVASAQLLTGWKFLEQVLVPPEPGGGTDAFVKSLDLAPAYSDIKFKLDVPNETNPEGIGIPSFKLQKIEATLGAAAATLTLTLEALPGFKAPEAPTLPETMPAGWAIEVGSGDVAPTAQYTQTSPKEATLTLSEVKNGFTLIAGATLKAVPIGYRLAHLGADPANVIAVEAGESICLKLTREPNVIFPKSIQIFTDSDMIQPPLDPSQFTYASETGTIDLTVPSGAVCLEICAEAIGDNVSMEPLPPDSEARALLVAEVGKYSQFAGMQVAYVDLQPRPDASLPYFISFNKLSAQLGKPTLNENTRFALLHMMTDPAKPLAPPTFQLLVEMEIHDVGFLFVDAMSFSPYAIGFVNPGGGSTDSGSSSSASPPPPPINVYHEPGAQGEGNQTVLQPANVAVEGETAILEVTSEEVDAWLAMAKAYQEEDKGSEKLAMILVPKIEGVTEYEVRFKPGDLKRLQTSGFLDAIGISTPNGEIQFHDSAFQGIEESANASFGVKLATINHQGRVGVDAKVLFGDQPVSVFEGDYGVEIRIPYEPKEGEDPNALFIEYIHEDGTLEIIRESHYDAEKKCLIFYTDHLSKYGVAYRPQLFSDVPQSHWASGNITFLASRKVISGSGNSKFYPDKDISKAEYISMLTKGFSAINFSPNLTQSYSDVPANAWYAQAVAWSYYNGITNALTKGSSKLVPDQSINRQDMALIADNVSQVLNLRLKNLKEPPAYQDGKSVDKYAQAAVQRMVKTGIMEVGANHKFNPQEPCSKAEAAKVISTLLSKM